VKTYVVKNASESLLELHFTDDSKVKLSPGKLWIWQGSEDNLEFLQENVDAGNLEVWTFEADWDSEQLVSQVAINFEWQQEGF
jgi:hypothetical protein